MRLLSYKLLSGSHLTYTCIKPNGTAGFLAEGEITQCAVRTECNYSITEKKLTKQKEVSLTSFWVVLINFNYAAGLSKNSVIISNSPRPVTFCITSTYLFAGLLNELYIIVYVAPVPSAVALRLETSVKPLEIIAL